MTTKNSWRVRLSQVLLGAALLLALVVVRGTQAGNEPIHLTTDWSHKHVVFSAPHNLGQHFHLLSNPRYVQQLVRRNSGSQGDPAGWRWRRAPEPGVEPLQGDWSMDMGPGAHIAEGNYPAKYSFDPTSAKCGTDPNPDYVVYNTSLAGSTTSVAASQTVTFGTSAGTPSGQTVIITNGASTLTLTSTAGVSSGLNFHVAADNTGGNRDANAASLAAAINLAGNGSSVGVSAASTAGSNVVTITDTTAGSAGNSITLTGTLQGSSGVTYGGNAFTGGVSPQASIGAFDNLYSGCTGTKPTVYWAYNTGGTVVTSPTLSGDGKQVAFVQNVGTTASLVLVKWKASVTDAFTAPTTLTTQASAAAYTTCTAPCMYTMAFTGTGTLTDTNSSPFYDFANDVMWVGDDGDHLQKFTGVFKGTPAHVTTGGFPATLTNGTVAGSPVFDDGSGKVFVADGTPAGLGSGYLYSVNATTGAVVQSVELSRGVGFKDGVILDPTSENLYLFTADNTGATCGTTENAIITMPAAFTAATTETSTNITPSGVCSPTLSMYDGTFDNAFYSGGAGHVYICGGIGGSPTLYQVPISAAGVVGAAATVVTGPALAATGNTCGPVTEFYNTSTSTDWIFTNVQGGATTGAPINCPTATGCIMSFNVTTATGFGTSTATVGHVAVTGGASGVIADNAVAAGTLAGASQVYFTPLADQPCTTSGGTGGCAIQASQSNLN